MKDEYDHLSVEESIRRLRYNVYILWQESFSVSRFDPQKLNCRGKMGQGSTAELYLANTLKLTSYLIILHLYFSLMY